MRPADSTVLSVGRPADSTVLSGGRLIRGYVYSSPGHREPANYAAHRNHRR